MEMIRPIVPPEKNLVELRVKGYPKHGDFLEQLNGMIADEVIDDKFVSVDIRIQILNGSRTLKKIKTFVTDSVDSTGIIEVSYGVVR